MRRPAEAAESACRDGAGSFADSNSNPLVRFRSHTCKDEFPPKSKRREQMRLRRVAAHFRGAIEPIVSKWSRKDALQQGLPLDGDKLEFYLAVADLSINPFEPTWAQLRLDTELDNAIADHRSDVVYLSVTFACGLSTS
jgi:hypothetical protein